MADEPRDNHSMALYSEEHGDQEEEEEVKKYLESFLGKENDDNGFRHRSVCCGSSRSLYCAECCRLLVPTQYWPKAIQHGDLKLPFALDVILTDRRNSATGLQAVSLLRTSAAVAREQNRDVEADETFIKEGIRIRSSHNDHPPVRMFDLERFPDDETFVYDDDDLSTTYLLFPSPGQSIPLSQVDRKTLQRLVVLDCRWTKSSIRNHKQISKLTKVHLSRPPLESFFWRWHNAGLGMVSTMEAIYYAAREVEGTCCFLDLLWLFALQRASMVSFSETLTTTTTPPPPFSREGKEERRALRRYIGTEKQARDKERGKLLRQQVKHEKKARQQQNEEQVKKSKARVP